VQRQELEGLAHIQHSLNDTCSAIMYCDKDPDCVDAFPPCKKITHACQRKRDRARQLNIQELSDSTYPDGLKGMTRDITLAPSAERVHLVIQVPRPWSTGEDPRCSPGAAPRFQRIIS
jgi:hypothetical protein